MYLTIILGQLVLNNILFVPLHVNKYIHQRFQDLTVN